MNVLDLKFLNNRHQYPSLRHFYNFEDFERKFVSYYSSMTAEHDDEIKGKVSSKDESNLIFFSKTDSALKMTQFSVKNDQIMIIRH